MMLGAVTAAWLGHVLDLPYVIHPIVIILAAVVVGGAYGYIPGVLKVKLGVNELISTIMLNEIAILVLEWVVNFPLRADAGSAAHSFIINETAWLPSFLPSSRWGVGFVIAIVMAVAIYFLLWRTSTGYEQRMSGNAPLFAKYGGIKNEKAALRGMIISGALAGLAGAIEVMGVNHRIMTGYSTGLASMASAWPFWAKHIRLALLLSPFCSPASGWVLNWACKFSSEYQESWAV